jgi:hypothetical protein
MVRIVLVLFVLAMALTMAEAQGPKKTVVKVLQVWSGSVEDDALLKGAPACVTTEAGFGKLWTKWKLPGKAPGVDFKKEIVLVETSSGSKLNLSANLDDKGNLQALGFGTRDFLPGFRFVLGTVSRDGVKTVNGKELPKE